MKFLSILLFFVLIFYGCGNPNSTKESLLEKRLDSLERQIVELKSNNGMREENEDDKKFSQSTPVQKPPSEPNISLDTKPIVMKGPEKEKLNQPAAMPSNDTTYYKYINGKISVKISPWSNGKRHLYFFDLKGIKTFELEDVRMSYTITTQLSFQSNGAANKAEIHNNPGGSMYWNESTITFSTTNDPLLKYDKKMPTSHLDQEEQKPLFWIPNEKKWMKQEIVKETNVPSQN